MAAGSSLLNFSNLSKFWHQFQSANRSFDFKHFSIAAIITSISVSDNNLADWSASTFFKSKCFLAKEKRVGLFDKRGMVEQNMFF